MKTLEQIIEIQQANPMFQGRHVLTQAQAERFGLEIAWRDRRHPVTGEQLLESGIVQLPDGSSADVDGEETDPFIVDDWPLAEIDAILNDAQNKARVAHKAETLDAARQHAAGAGTLIRKARAVLAEVPFPHTPPFLRMVAAAAKPEPEADP